MMEKSARTGEDGGMHAHPLSPYLPSRKKVVVYAPAERADTLSLFLLYTLYVLCAENHVMS
jgi:hypothetical protein